MIVMMDALYSMCIIAMASFQIYCSPLLPAKPLMLMPWDFLVDVLQTSMSFCSASRMGCSKNLCFSYPLSSVYAQCLVHTRLCYGSGCSLCQVFITCRHHYH